MYDYLQTESITNRLCYRYRFDFWIPKDHFFTVSRITLKKYNDPSKWGSIGLVGEKGYLPAWDVFLPSDHAIEILKSRLQESCESLGYKVSE